MSDETGQVSADGRSLTDRLHGTVGPPPDTTSEPSPGPLDRVTELIRQRPVVLIAAVAAGFLLGRLVKRAIRGRSHD
ncbi:hypothetical protein [Actinocatenispora rupis]|uniref:Uncharacterized protein n=1 Tax=Actinocatenispora rupis TaxID=519421 RepID=A0A8J3J6M1_9ACTN|nr:hypothetical protein [Actinocatenispora rupis]GID10363.1 hypothetical protein Aru02nite_12520 [Actinocatenispora rupis]